MVLADSTTRVGESIVLQRRAAPRPRAADDAGAEPRRLAKFHVPEILFGPESLAEVAHAALRLGARRPLLVTDPGLRAAGWPDRLLAHLADAGLDAVVWDGVTPNPKDHEIAAGHEHYLAEDCDVVVALGGGSVIDAAKGIALLVTDPGLRAAGWPDRLLAHLTDAGLDAVVWDGVTPNPKDHEIAAGHQHYLDEDCDVVVALGGGSVIDAAKGIALLVGNGGRITDYEGVDRMALPIPPLVMAPSTSGTGADVSQFCIVTDTRRNAKITILGRALVPDVSIVDPQLLMTMPDWLNAATGLDALTHGVEAFVSRAHNPLTDHHALQAIALVGGHLERTMDHPRDGEARTCMAQAALQGGLAFTNAILGAAHAMSHQVGGLLDLPHGVINGVLLPHVIRFNADAAPERFVPIAQALGFPGTTPDSTAGARDAAEWAACEVRRLADELGVPRGLAEIGVTEADVDQLAVMTLADACLSTNPREADKDDIEALFRTALW